MAIRYYANWEDSNILELIEHPDNKSACIDLIYNDYLDVVKDKKSVIIGDDKGRGVLLFEWRPCNRATLYRIHSLCLPELRGKKFKRFLGGALEFMKNSFNARLIEAAIPKTNRAACLMAAQSGFKLYYGINGVLGACNLYCRGL